MYKTNAENLNDIFWETPNLFRRYIYDYNKWITGAIDCIKDYKTYENEITLVSSDLKRYYYSTNYDFKPFLSDISNFQVVDYLMISEKVIKKVYEKYHSIIRKYSNMELGNSVLPIGLTSSVLIANGYLSELDLRISRREDVLYYGRYVDDLLIIFKGHIEIEKSNSLLNQIISDLNYGVRFNQDKTRIFHYHDYNFKSELERLINFIHSRSDHYYSNEDQEALSFRRYFEFEKDILKSNLMKNGSENEENFSNIDVKDAVLFMNYIYDLIDFKKETLEDIYNKIMSYIESADKFTMWKEFYRWVITFRKKQKHIDTIDGHIKSKYERLIDKNIIEVKPHHQTYVREKLLKTYNKINSISRVLGGDLNKSKKLDKNLFSSGMCRKDNILKFLTINYRNKTKLYDNSTRFYKEYYKNYIPFIHLWEVLMFDQLVNLSKKSKKTYKESIETFMEINKIESFDYISFEENENIKNTTGIVFSLNEKTNFSDFVVSHPNIVFDNNYKPSLVAEPKPPTVKETRVFMRNLLSSIENNTSTLVLPELYVKLEWLKLLAQIAHYNQFNVTFGLENIILGRRFYNVIVSLYSFEDKSLRRNLFATVREKNFYSYEEMVWCKKNKLTCRNPLNPFYFLVKTKGISFADYLCFEITDIYSRALFKEQVDVVLIPMLNKDTTYFDNIIQSLSRDLSCCVITANSASWGNSSVILPKASYEKILTEFKGGFNSYLVSTQIPIYKLIMFNKTFDWKKTIDKKFKKHPANFQYRNNFEDTSGLIFDIEWI